MRRKKLSLAVFAALLTWATHSEAASSMENRPKVIVSPSAVVKGSQIRLGDIAVITAKAPEHQKLLRDLTELSLGEAPAPRTKIGIPGARILAAIQGLGVPMDTIGYSIPQIVQVERAGRILGTDEVMTEARDFLSRDPKLDIQIRDVTFETAQILPVGATKLEFERLGAPSGGKIPLRVLARVEEIPAARFMATAIVDDWREVPVLNKPLERGMLITPSDVELVRLNMFKQPPDIADNLEEVVGRAVKNRISAGETLRKSLIDIPPLVEQGRRVTLLYKNGGLQATATGVAMDNGLRGDSIRVKNESSKKIVKAKIASADVLEVEAQ